MKKTTWILVFSLVALLLFSCKKDESVALAPVQRTLTLAMDTAFSGKVVAPPKVKLQSAQWSLFVGEFDNFVVNSFKITFTTASGNFPAGIIKNVYLTVTNEATNNIATSPSVASATQTVSIPGPLPRNKNSKHTVKLFYDVTDPAFRDQVTPSLELFHESTVGLGNTGAKQGQTMTFALPSLSTAATYSMPSSKMVYGNQKVETFTFSASASGGDIEVSKVDVGVADVTLVQSAELYAGASFLGAVSPTGTTVSIPVTLSIPGGSKTDFSVKLKLFPVGNLQAGTNIKTSLLSVHYRTPTGEVKVNDTVRGGYDLYVYKSVPKIDVQPLPGTLQNGVSAPIIKVVCNATGNPFAVKTLGFPVSVADNGSNDTITLASLKAFFGGTDVSAFVRFTKANGDTISVITESDQVVYVSFISAPGQFYVPVGTKELIIWGTRYGADPNEGDAISLTLGSDLTQTSYRYLNSGGTPFGVRLYGSQPPNASAQSFYCIWTDLCATAPSPAIGASTADWYNGYLVYQSQPTQVWLRR